MFVVLATSALVCLSLFYFKAMTRLDRCNKTNIKKPLKAKKRPKRKQISKRDVIDMSKYTNYEKAIRLRYSLLSKITKSEAQIYKYLNTREIPYIKQYPIEIGYKMFIVDAYLPLHNLIIEVDGGIHKIDSVAKRDIERDNILIANGYNIIHIGNEDVKNLVLFGSSELDYYLCQCNN